MDVSALKADLKTWERDFKLKNGRPPTIDDIKADPIEAKYKLHRKLTKDPARAKTPPRTRPPYASQRSPYPKAKPEESNVPAPFNPFSPVKIATSTVNPFLTPRGKQKFRETTPDSTPGPSQPNASTVSPNQSLVKARKRLRGEDVSPSPIEKRQRIISGIIDPDSEPLPATGSVFRHESEEGMSDSPVKPSVDSKSFTPLFGATNGNAHSLQRSVSLVNNLFGIPKKAIDDMDVDWEPIAATEKVPLPAKKTHASKQRKVLPGPRGLIPSKDDLRAVTTTVPSEAPQASGKELPPSPQSPHDVASTSSLLPPSPTNKDAFVTKSQKYKQNGKKSNSSTAHPAQDDNLGKKQDTSDEFKIVDYVSPRYQRRRMIGDDEDIETITLPVRRPISQISPENFASEDAEHVEDELPEEMHRVLSLQDSEAEARRRRREEEYLFKDLVYGTRLRKPDKGAEIWDAGEWDAEQDRETAEDWDEEGLAWEAGTL
ncbi:hypothetical protein SISNIDRAFT_548038 [Sistotremastrum niveocremeum HHB9708]|uniref:DNA replication regulator SLD2 n=1 Tax=Sistotremastrum niveocremeum HHB9708 TaxID=1314777 RepID=A0A164XEH5_9AGAM|nr:hypothetical protein SISNIDRAFT_548038 [Sistotremastrum niveocremeum HHB9708]